METNRIYTAYSVLKKYIDDHGYTITNYSLLKQSPDRVIMWVDENPEHHTHFVCIKMSCTQFLIWGYGEDYKQSLYTSFDFADQNTPYLYSGDVPYYGGTEND